MVVVDGEEVGERFDVELEKFINIGWVFYFFYFLVIVILIVEKNYCFKFLEIV